MFNTDSVPASLKKILNLNETPDTSESEHANANGLLAPVAPILDADGNPIWKVLVFDDLGRDVISSVMRVSDLRAMGVTMHMLVEPRRDAWTRLTCITPGTLREQGILYPTFPSYIS
jgi:hypothetical protein